MSSRRLTIQARSLKACKTESGFTLIEVMVAVAILGVAMPALLFAMLSQIDATAYLRDKLLAQWVAENVVADLRVENVQTGRVATGKRAGEQEMAGQTWYWRSEAKAFSQEEFKDVYGVRIRIYKEKNAKDEDVIAELTGIMRQYQQSAIVRPKPESPPAINAGGNSGNNNDTNDSAEGS